MQKIIYVVMMTLLPLFSVQASEPSLVGKTLDQIKDKSMKEYEYRGVARKYIGSGKPVIQSGKNPYRTMLIDIGGRYWNLLLLDSTWTKEIKDDYRKISLKNLKVVNAIELKLTRDEYIWPYLCQNVDVAIFKKGRKQLFRGWRLSLQDKKHIKITNPEKVKCLSPKPIGDYKFKSDSNNKFECGNCSSPGCYIHCYVTCDRYGGRNRMGKGKRECNKCQGAVITVINSTPVDGMTLRVCKGEMKK